MERAARWPLLAVAAAVAFDLWVLRAEATSVALPNDAAIHTSMVAFAAHRIAGGHLPLDGWYPDVALGSSRFHHYQSLPHVLAALPALAVGARTVVAWSTYLLLALWPIAVYAGGRLLGLERWPAALAAVASPLVVSEPGLGYEWGSYAWRGYGTWTQLFGMWLLPFAWALGFRAVDRGGRFALPAAVLALTVAVHLLTGYLALLSLAIFALVRPRELPRRLARVAIVGVGALLVAAWTVWPLLADRIWTVQDEFSRNAPYYDSFGARRVLGWLVTGGILDRGRFPVLTLACALGFLIALRRARAEPYLRALLGVGLLSLLLFFGRPTLGPVLRLLPGSGDLFLRRYVSGVHLAGLYLVGLGLTLALGLLARAAARLRGRPLAAPAAAVLAPLAAAGALAPAWTERAAWAAQGAAWIAEQRAADATDGADVAELIAIARARGPGRIYAGMRSNWGARYRVGHVPLYAVLVQGSMEQVGFTRPTWSLSSPIEYRFADARPDHLDLFGIRYLLYPEDRAPPAGAREIARSGRHVLFELPGAGYVEVVDVAPAIAAGRTDLGVRMEGWLRSSDVGRRHPGVAFEGQPAPPPTTGEGPPGEVLAEDVALREGRASAEVALRRPAAVLLETSFDPRWRASVDGRAVRTWMLAPSFVGALVPPGRHRVTFVYEPFPRSDVALAVGLLTLALLALAPRLRRPLSRRARAGTLGAPQTAGAPRGA
ncbi:MAG: hypothetical protein KatS3mg014_2051 [Actinomycetota bacterium]|nr:MAG: hypothetical protein KatS3mg014_2051 [Actinomycetota bacterium]